MKRALKTASISILAIIVAGYLVPERKAMPCGTPNDYNHESFWAWPWSRGRDGYPHAGVDIFGRAGDPVTSQTGGIVVFSGYAGKVSGNAVCVLGPKWRLHHYLHLDSAEAKAPSFVMPGARIGTIGKTGNAAGTPAHVHYGLVTPIPYVWKASERVGKGDQPSRFDWMRMFYLNPMEHIPTE